MEKTIKVVKQIIPEKIKDSIRPIITKSSIYKSLDWKYRLATWRKRGLPDFIIIGAQKSGTSSLNHYLTQHPQIVRAFRKEVHFFDGGLDAGEDNYAKGESWYRAFFPKRKTLSEDQKIFEDSPLYIFNPLAPGRIAELIPDVKLIALLRNPTDRAISNYFLQKNDGNEPLSIMEALLAEEERMREAVTNQDYISGNFRWYSYKARGRYCEQIKRYLNYFDFNDMLIINSERFFSNTEATLQKAFRFLGVDANFSIPDISKRNVSKNKTGVMPEVYDYLNDYFRPYNEALYSLIGERFDW